MSKQKEAEIKKGIRNLLRLLRIPHRNIWQGQFSDPGISDLIGVIPNLGRALFIEVKVPGHRKDTKTYRAQEQFLNEMRGAGALAFFAEDPREVVARLRESGYDPAIRILG